MIKFYKTWMSYQNITYLNNTTKIRTAYIGFYAPWRIKSSPANHRKKSCEQTRDRKKEKKSWLGNLRDWNSTDGNTFIHKGRKRDKFFMVVTIINTDREGGEGFINRYINGFLSCLHFSRIMNLACTDNNPS